MNRRAHKAAGLAFVGASLPALGAHAAPLLPLAGQQTSSPESLVRFVVMFALASLLPGIILATTCFARFAIVFSFLKTGLGTQGAPPQQILIGLSLFMTVFVMAPVAAELHRNAGKPYMAGEIDEVQALEAATPTLQRFLIPRTRQGDLALFYAHADLPQPRSEKDVPLRVAVPAFVISEMRTAFEMGLVILLPFLIIDLVVATVLSSLGMVMLPPVFVSLPIKVLVFVTADGWNLLVSSLLKGVGT